ncbi:hypothetical protein [Lactobacillus sp. PV034]|uniref:hypothetical protein n=1 Tax=Lactobacillus sp. PV034 TaxID=2594495 RepID=UPI0022405ED7|nr:hypothetical protein [Lactobacillus sp. PV034]QNQ80799.1 hypothetical protein FP432_04140 [Lactobacillus sp. PV034]
MKGNMSFTVNFKDPQLGLIENRVEDYLGEGYAFKIDSYKVTYVSAIEAKVYVEFTKHPKNINLNIGELEVPYKVFNELQKDMKSTSFKGLKETIINALDNYYEV